MWPFGWVSLHGVVVGVRWPRFESWWRHSFTSYFGLWCGELREGERWRGACETLGVLEDWVECDIVAMLWPFGWVSLHGVRVIIPAPKLGDPGSSPGGGILLQTVH